MAWYKVGTVSITNGQTSVTGVGTKFASNARVGDALRGPDGQWYEVVNIASETTLGIYPAYLGATVSNNANYTIAPMQGYVKDSADALRAIVNSQADISGSVAAAAASAAAAKTSETKSKTSETNAKTSETNSKASETASKTSETNAGTSASTATSQATTSTNARIASETARDLAQKWASNPENTVVTGSSYSALHWAAKAKASADSAAAVTGPRLTSIANLVMAVNDMLIADSTTTMTKIASGAIGRSMLAVATAAAGRDVLALKGGAISDVTSTNVDATAGKLLKVGDFGLGAVNAPQATAANDLSYSGFYYVASNATNIPVAVNGVLHHYAFSDGSAAYQMYSSLFAPTRTFMRTKSSGTWLAWKEIWTSENLVKTTSTQDSTLGSMLKVGDFGFGKDSVTITDPDTVYRGSGFYDVASGQSWEARPIPGWTRIFHQSHANSAGYATQIATADFTSLKPRLFYRNCNNGTWTTWFELWSSNSFVLSSSNIDPDMSKVARTGDFGIGNTNAAPLANNANAIAASGMYATNASGTITNYPVSANGMLIHSEWNGDAGASQIFITTASNQMWFRNQTAGNWQPWKELWSSSNLVKTASPTDTTAGRMVQVGDFGANGGDVIGLSANVSWDTVTTPAEYVVYSATGANTPPGGGSFFITVRKFSNNFKQIAVNLTNASSFSRLWNGTTWSSWDLSFSRATILGTVSQTSGVPTGAIIERGSNANGEYTKFADGTMICTGKSSGTVTTSVAGVNVYYNTIASMTFASTFSSVPSLQLSTDRTTKFFTWAAQQSTPTVSETGVLAVVSGASNGVCGISYVAVGRWF